MFELTVHFKHDRNLAKISKKLRIKWNFELTVFELTVPDLYLSHKASSNVSFNESAR